MPELADEFLSEICAGQGLYKYESAWLNQTKKNFYERKPASAETFRFEDTVSNCIKRIWSLDENSGMLLFKYSDLRE